MSDARETDAAKPSGRYVVEYGADGLPSRVVWVAALAVVRSEKGAGNG